MFDRLHRRRRERAASIATQASAQQAKELADAWKALDDATREDIVAAAQELKDLHDKHKIQFVRACYRGDHPNNRGGWRTAEDLRAEAAFIRATFEGRDKQAAL